MEKESNKKSLSINPVVGTVLVAIIGLLGTGIGASIGGYYSIRLEQEKLRSSLILKAVETTDPKSALNYLKFLQNTGLVKDLEVTIEEWSKDSTAVPLRPTPNQVALAEMDNTVKSVRVASTDKLISESSADPDVIREVVSSLKVPKSPDGMWNNIVFLNSTKKSAYDTELIEFSLTEVAAFEAEVKKGNILLGPKTKDALNTYKKYLSGMQAMMAN